MGEPERQLAGPAAEVDDERGVVGVDARQQVGEGAAAVAGEDGVLPRVPGGVGRASGSARGDGTVGAGSAASAAGGVVGSVMSSRFLSMSRVLTATTVGGMSADRRPADDVDEIVAAWRRERPDLDVSPLEVLSRVSRLARRLDLARGSAFSEHLLDGWAFDVLSALRRAGEPYELSPGQLVQQTLVTSGTMTNRVDRLERSGFVERRPDPGDRRGVLVRLTPAGRDVVDSAMADLIEQEKSLLSELSATDRTQLAGLLRRMLAPLETAGDPRDASRLARLRSSPGHRCACWNSSRLPTGSVVWKRRRPGMLVVPRHRRPRLPDGERRARSTSPTGDAGVGLARRDEALLDADVHLGGPGPEPRAAAGAQPLGLVDLGHPEHADVEGAHGVLAARRTGHLDVVQEHLHAPKVS